MQRGVSLHLVPREREHLTHNLSARDYLSFLTKCHRKGNVRTVSHVINIVPHREFLIFYEHLKVWFRSLSVLWPGVSVCRFGGEGRCIKLLITSILTTDHFKYQAHTRHATASRPAHNTLDSQ